MTTTTLTQQQNCQQRGGVGGHSRINKNGRLYIATKHQICVAQQQQKNLAFLESDNSNKRIVKDVGMEKVHVTTNNKCNNRNKQE